MKLKHSLSILTAGLLLMGCASLNKPSIRDIPESPPGMSKCQPIVKDGNYQDFGQVLMKLIDTITAYNNCADTHNALVEYELKKGDPK